jgi:hypothetical protein
VIFQTLGLINQVKGGKKPKNHEQPYAPDDIDRNSAIQIYHTGPTEQHQTFHVIDEALELVALSFELGLSDNWLLEGTSAIPLLW